MNFITLKYNLLVFTLFITTIISCTKWSLDKENPNHLAEVTIDNISENSGIYNVTGTISDLGYRSKIEDYGIVYSKDNTPTLENSISISKGGTSSLSNFDASIETYDNSSTYYVRAYATNGAGTYYSIASSFTTSTTQNETVSLISPNNGAEVDMNSTTFSWSVSGASLSHIQVASNNNFSSLVYDNDNVTRNSIELTGFIESTTYYWRVKASISGSWTNWSVTRNFTASASGGSGSSDTPSLTYPTDEQILTDQTNINFQWSVVTGANSYEIEIDETSAMTSPSFSDTSSTTNKTISGLSLNQTYYWRVRSYDGTSYSNWSSIFSFSLETGSILSTLTTIPSATDITLFQKLIPFEESGNWSLLAVGVKWSTNATNARQIIRYNIGTTITNSPSYVSYFTAEDYTTSFEFIEYNNNYYGFQLRPYFGYPFERLNFGTDPYSTPSTANLLDEMPYTTYGLSLIDFGGKIWGVSTNTSNELIRIGFDNGIESTSYSTFSFGVSNIEKAYLQTDGTNLYGIAQNTNDNIEFWDFGTSMSTAGLIITEITLSYSSLKDVKMFKNGSNWYAIVVGGGNGTSYAKLLDFGGYPDNSFNEYNINIDDGSLPYSTAIINKNSVFSVFVGTEMGIYSADISSYIN